MTEKPQSPATVDGVGEDKPHNRFISHLKNGGIVLRVDPLNKVVELIDINKLSGDADKIKFYGYNNLTCLDFEPTTPQPSPASDQEQSQECDSKVTAYDRKMATLQYCEDTFPTHAKEYLNIIRTALSQSVDKQLSRSRNDEPAQPVVSREDAQRALQDHMDQDHEYFHSDTFHTITELLEAAAKETT
jgi:hypothetical protein